MLVLLAALTRARIVASHLRTRADWFSFFDCGRRFADDIASCGWSVARGLLSSGVRPRSGAAKRTRRLVGCLAGNIAQKVFEGHQTRGATEDVVTDLGFDIDHEIFEDFECFGLVFNQGIPLAMSA